MKNYYDIIGNNLIVSKDDLKETNMTLFSRTGLSSPADKVRGNCNQDFEHLLL